MSARVELSTPEPVMPERSVSEHPVNEPRPVLPPSALHRLRRYVNQGGRTQRRLELGLVVVLSGLSLMVANALWQPKPREAVPSVAQLDSAKASPPTCDDPTAMAKYLRWLDTFEDRSSSREPIGDENLEAYGACARKEADAPGEMASLHNAAVAGRLRTVRWLLSAATARRSDLNLAVLEADAHPDVAALLRSKGAEPPGLLDAAGKQAPNAVRAALQRQTAEPAELSTALMLFVQRGSACTACDPRAYAREQSRTVDLFFSKEAKIDGRGLAALCERGTEMTDAHLASALAHRQPGAVEWALGSAAPSVPEAVIRRVAAEGIDWGYRDGEDDAPMPLVRAVANRNEMLVRVLVELGAPVDRVYKDGSSAFESAVTCGEGETACGRIAEFLLEQGADPNRRFPNGSTPLFAAAEAGSGRVVRALIDAGARLETRVLRETPLMAAERTGNTLAARILAARGARVPGEAAPFGL